MPFTAASARPTEMGEGFTTHLATRLVRELNPVCLAMVGICAGNQDDVFLGDVIVADRVFKIDDGKLKVYIEEKENTNIREEEVSHNIQTYNLSKRWKHQAEDFSNEWIATVQRSRPKSYAHQERWILHHLYLHDKKL
ncbi:MAG: hypothetical protein GY749_31180 [Desulfobacteraceae bacterium]|nr:hypothetical protein [Desulfobacteraceae bacterium]